jgi:hypothetical protein
MGEVKRDIKWIKQVIGLNMKCPEDPPDEDDKNKEEKT